MSTSADTDNDDPYIFCRSLLRPLSPTADQGLPTGSTLPGETGWREQHTYTLPNFITSVVISTALHVLLVAYLNFPTFDLPPRYP